MSQEGKYSVLFMRDDSRVRRLRMSPFWLRAALYALLLVAIVAGLGVWGSVHFWRASEALAEDKLALERQLTEARLRLERLHNVEKLLKGGDVEDLKALQQAPAPQDAKGRKDAKDGKDAPAPAVVDLAALFSRVDLRQVGVENFKTVFAEDQFKVAFDLNNLAPATPLSGQAMLWLVTNSGQQVKAVANDADLAFQIQRLKKFAISFPSPKGLDRKELYALRLVVNGPSGVIFSETYILSALLG